MMRLSDKIYQACYPIWEQCNHHPFIEGMIDGSLPLYKYRFYTMQCDWYLLEFARTLSLGMLKAPDAEVEYFFLEQMNATLADHKELYKQLSITEEDIRSQIIHPDNAAYASYSRELALSGGLAEVIASVMACYWSYKILGEYMHLEMTEDTPEIYRGLCEKFYDPYYAESVDRMIELIDDLTSDCTEEELDRYTDMVRRCSQYELAFWQMCWDYRP